MPAATMPIGSKPAFSQKLASSIAVVASMRTGGMSLNSTTSRLNSPNRASSTLCSRSHTIDCSGSTMVSSFCGRREALAQLAVGGDGDARAHDSEDRAGR